MTTVTLDPVVPLSPLPDADTVVLPPASGSNAIPPAPTPIGVRVRPTPICAVTLCPVSAVVTSWATALALFVTVTVRAVPPKRIGSSASIPVPDAFSIPIRTWKSMFGELALVEVGTESRSIPSPRTVTVAVAVTKPAAETVIVAVPVTPSSA